MSLFVSYSSIFKYLKVLKRLKQAKARMQKMETSLWKWHIGKQRPPWWMGHLSGEHLETIMKHTMGFRYFSLAYIEVKQNPFKEPQATVHAIFKSSVLFVSWTWKCKSVWPVDM